MPLYPLRLPPGVYRNGTEYQSKGRYYDANLVRWSEGTMRPVGGWTALPTTVGVVTLTGVPRGALAWRTNDGAQRWAAGTASKLYAYTGGTLVDITPTDLTTGGTDTTTGEGYGTGTYGNGDYGLSGVSSTIVGAGVWSLDTFGEYLVGVLAPSDGRIVYWDLVPANDAIEVDAGAPVDNLALVVTPERFLVALGADGNKTRVQWASQETMDTWTPAGDNSAGDFDLATEGAIVAGMRSRNETLIWTDVDVHAMRYIGGTFIYSFDKLGDNCGLIAPNAKVMFEGGAAWMSLNGFFVYDGYVKQLPCDVSDYVYGDMNRFQRRKFWATTVGRFGEVWFFYCSAVSDEIDRYVIWNYRENHWSIGMLDRTAGADIGVFTNPIWAASDGNVYRHESGMDHDAVEVFAETGPIELGEGERVMELTEITPDEKTQGQVSMTVYGRLYPNGDELTFGPYSAAEPTPVRVTARHIRLRYSDTSDANDWRVGTPRIEARPGGRR